MKKRSAIILAAGKGTRMKSQLYKVLHSIAGLSMVEHVFRAVKGSGVSKVVTVTGHGAQAVKEVLGQRSEYVYQEEQLGTGHAVRQAEEALKDEEGHTLVICGDTPLLTEQTLEELFNYHEATNAKATILTAVVDNPTNYGRVVRNDKDEVAYIVEEKDASAEEKAVQEINTGTYVFDNKILFEALSQITNDNAQGEYYLTDVIEIITNQKETVGGYVLPNEEEALGVNDRVALSKATKLMQQRINETHMLNGVTMIDPDSIYIEADVTIEPDVTLEPGVILKGETTIQTGSIIGSHSEIIDSTIKSNTYIRQSVINQSIVDERVTIGPFAHLRPDTHLKADVHVGNFVEVKNSVVGEKTRIGHLSYIGDVDMGSDVNVGAGTVFVNYDGKRKFRSIVGNRSFIGCDSQIISPVTIEDETVIGAGTTVTKDVPTKSLAISRINQKNIENYWEKFNNK